MFGSIDVDWAAARLGWIIAAAALAWVVRVSVQLGKIETKLDPLVVAKEKHSEAISDHEGRILVLERAPARST